VALYFTTPFVVFAVFCLNQREYPTATDAELKLTPAAAHAIVVGGGLSVLMSAFLYLLPYRAIGIWPWHLTPLTARMLGAVFALGLAGLGAVRERRWSSARILFQVEGIMLLLILVAGVRAHDQFDASKALTWLFTAGFVSTALATVICYVGMETRARSASTPGH
jgi:hypothetical protein